MNNIYKFLKEKNINKYVNETNELHIAFSQNNIKYTALNKNKKNLLKLIIDNGIIKDYKIKKCDNGIYIDCDKKFILIELKGCDIETALKQLYSTYEWFEKINNHSLKIMYSIRIVFSKYCKGINLNFYKKKFYKKGIFDIKYSERNFLDDKI